MCAYYDNFKICMEHKNKGYKKVKRIRIISPFLIRIIGVDLKLYTLRCCKMTQLSVRGYCPKVESLYSYA